jgi:arginine/lysine/ornithine decarboxylase
MHYEPPLTKSLCAEYMRQHAATFRALGHRGRDGKWKVGQWFAFQGLAHYAGLLRSMRAPRSDS